MHSNNSRTTVTIWTRLYGVASIGQPGQRIQTNIVGRGSGVLRSSLHTRRSISRNNNRHPLVYRYRLLFRGVPRQAVKCGPYPRRSSLAWNIRALERPVGRMSLDRRETSLALEVSVVQIGGGGQWWPEPLAAVSSCCWVMCSARVLQIVAEVPARGFGACPRRSRRTA